MLASAHPIAESQGLVSRPHEEWIHWLAARPAKPLGRLYRAVQPPATSPAGTSPHIARSTQVERAYKALAFIAERCMEQSGESRYPSTTNRFSLQRTSAFTTGLFYLWSILLPLKFVNRREGEAAFLPSASSTGSPAAL